MRNPFAKRGTKLSDHERLERGEIMRRQAIEHTFRTGEMVIVKWDEKLQDYIATPPLEPKPPDTGEEDIPC